MGVSPERVQSKFARSITNQSTNNKTITPKLHRRPEFETALTNYSPSPEALAVLKSTAFVPMAAPTATGRNTIIRELLRTNNYYFVVSDTTRPARYNDGVLEQNGVEYFFRSEQEMLEDIKAGRFIEAEIIHGQQVSGVSIREVEKAHSLNKVAITDMEILGADRITKISPSVTVICLLPPSFDEWMTRINKRNKVEPDELHRRLQTATKIIKIALQNDKFVFVVNDQLKVAVRTVDDIAREGVHHPAAEAQARRLAEQLYQQTVEYLRRYAPEVKPY